MFEAENVFLRAAPYVAGGPLLLVELAAELAVAVEQDAAFHFGNDARDVHAAAADGGLALEGALGVEDRLELALVTALLLEDALDDGAVHRDADRHLVGRTLGTSGDIHAHALPSIGHFHSVGRACRKHSHCRQGRDCSCHGSASRVVLTCVDRYGDAGEHDTPCKTVSSTSTATPRPSPPPACAKPWPRPKSATSRNTRIPQSNACASGSASSWARKIRSSCRVAPWATRSPSASIAAWATRSSPTRPHTSSTL